MRRNRFSRDPHWITTKYPTKLANGETVPAGTRAFYVPSSRTCLFGEEADAAARRFEAECFDEAQYRAGRGM